MRHSTKQSMQTVWQAEPPVAMLRTAMDKKTNGLRRILVVDDHPDTARSYYELLSVMGHECEFRTDARTVMDAARAMRPHIVLLDIGLLPDLDGHRIAGLLRDEFGRDLTIVAVTAYGRDEDRLRTRKAGFDAHV